MERYVTFSLNCSFFLLCSGLHDAKGHNKQIERISSARDFSHHWALQRLTDSEEEMSNKVTDQDHIKIEKLSATTTNMNPVAAKIVYS